MQQPPSSQQQQAAIPGSRTPSPSPAPRLDAALDVVWLPQKQQG